MIHDGSSEAGIIFLWVLIAGGLAYLGWLFLTDYRATRAFWRQEDKRQGRRV